MVASIDKGLFGNGYSTEDEKTNLFIFANDRMRYNAKAGVGGGVPVRGYDGPWPIFGEVEDSWEAQHLKQMDGSEAGPSEISTINVNRGPRMMCRSTGKCRACSDKDVSETVTLSL